MYKKNLGLLLILSLVGCGVVQKSYEKGMQLGKEAVELKHYHYDFNVVSDHKLNRTDVAEDNTFRMVVFQLRDKSLFQKASYYDLLINAQTTLTHDILEQNIYLISPFSQQDITGNINSGAKYLGLVFFFNKPNADEKTWKIIFPVEDLSLFKSSYILVDGSTAQIKSRKDLKNLLKEQKNAEKAKIKEEKKQKKLAKEKQKEQLALEKARKQEQKTKLKEKEMQEKAEIKAKKLEEESKILKEKEKVKTTKDTVNVKEPKFKAETKILDKEEVVSQKKLTPQQKEQIKNTEILAKALQNKGEKFSK